MSLLTICQDVAVDIGIARPMTIVGSSGIDERRLLRMANRVGRELAARASWQALRRQHVFTAVAGETQGGAIPSDFLRFCPETMWDRTNERAIIGPVDPAEYQARRISVTDGTLRWFTRRGNNVLIWPPLKGGETIAFEYQSDAFCQSSSFIPQSEWLADTDTGRIDEELITLGMIQRLLEAEGQPFATAKLDFERRLATLLANDVPDARVVPAGDLFGAGRYFTGEMPDDDV